MIKYIFITILLLVFLIPLKATIEIERYQLFSGDKHGDFKNDIVVYLTDGSGWKTHPNDKDLLSTWKPGESIHISLRTSYYYFKREHKFLLYNHDRKESVKAMLIDYGPHPLSISSTSGVYFTDTDTIPITFLDENGEIFTIYELEPIYKKDISLNDGSTCVIYKHFNAFIPDAQVYIGFNETPDEFFIITGQEREAVWSSISLQ
ncbi:MAG: hypothetical protein P4L16_03065 [Chlamydiales bacterium]|nr:hypothetical protein [Chlamydiales bacterium]